MERVRLVAAPPEVATARACALRVLKTAGVVEEPHIGDVRLLVSELATNGIRAAARCGWPVEPGAEAVEVTVHCRPRWTHIIVSDPDPNIPDTVEAVPDYDALDPGDIDDLDEIEESGRGLQIVTVLGAHEWWVPRAGGKEAHAVINRPGHALLAAERQLLQMGVLL